MHSSSVSLLRLNSPLPQAFSEQEEFSYLSSPPESPLPPAFSPITPNNSSARVGHRTTSGQFNHVSAQNCTRSAKMSGQVSQSSEPPQKKRCVAIRTVQNWL